MSQSLVDLRIFLSLIGLIEDEIGRAFGILKDIESQISRLFDRGFMVDTGGFNESPQKFGLNLDLNQSHKHGNSVENDRAFILTSLKPLGLLSSLGFFNHMPHLKL